MAQTSIGTPYYISPEICQGHQYSFKSDIWSLGCLLFEILTKEKPFQGKFINEIVFNILQGKFKEIEGEFSSDIKNLVKMMLDKDPES